MASMNILNPLILHIPHASTHIPDSVKAQFSIDQASLESELNKMTDHFTDWLVEPLNASPSQKVIAPISRLVVDMERFADDKQEVMAKVGMGVMYVKGSQKQSIRHSITNEQRKSLLDSYYWPHHNELIEKTQQRLSANGYALVLDIHSYPNNALPYEINQTQHRPEICIGTCDFHTPASIVNAAIKAFTDKGFEVALNEPFAGTLIPTPFWQTNAKVMGMMIEVRRDLYMDETKVELLDNSDETRAKICDSIESLMSSVNEINWE